jgi:hypothetical protein
MALIPIFTGRVSPASTLELAEHERDRRRKWLSTLVGHDVEVIVRRVPRQRTLDQNSYIHAVPATLVAEETGKTIEEAKRDLMGDCWGWKRDLATGELKPVKAHTASMSVEEATYFIEWVGPFCLEKYGIEIPLPGEVEFR